MPLEQDSSAARRRRAALIAPPILLGLALLLGWQCAKPAPVPTTVPRSGLRGAPTDVAGLVLQVAHVTWSSPLAPGHASVAKALEAALWQGPGKDALQRLGEATWPGTGFKVVKLERYPIAPGRSVEFRGEPRFHLPADRVTIETTTVRFQIIDKAGEMYRTTDSKDALLYDDGHRSRGIDDPATLPLPLELNQVDSASMVTPKGAFAIVYACYRGSEDKRSEGDAKGSSSP